MSKYGAYVWLGILMMAGIWLLSDLPVKTADALMLEQEELMKERAMLEERVSGLEKGLLQMEQAASLLDIGMAGLKVSLRVAEWMNGAYDMIGPGVEVILSDARPELRGENAAWAIVHDEDVLHVVNALTAAGAECVAVNDVRILANTRIRCGGPTIHVRDRRLTPPFIITAIGDPAALEQVFSLPLDGGASLRDEFNAFGLTFSVTKKNNVVVKRSLEGRHFQYAVAVDE